MGPARVRYLPRPELTGSPHPISMEKRLYEGSFWLEVIVFLYNLFLWNSWYLSAIRDLANGGVTSN